MTMTPHALGHMHSLHLARVTDTEDPDRRGRIQVMLLATGMEVWASVVVPSAGRDYGISFLPKLDEIVALSFITPEQPLVLGSIWSGGNSAPEAADPEQERYVLRTPSGTTMSFNDDDGPKMEIKTPMGFRITLTDGNGGEVEIERDGQRITMSASEINVTSSGTVSINASRVNISAGMVQVDAGMSRFSGVVQADTVITNSVVSASYTPGAGNIW